MRPTCNRLLLPAALALAAAAGCAAPASQYLERRGRPDPSAKASRTVAAGPACPARIGLRECTRIGTFDEIWVVAAGPGVTRVGQHAPAGRGSLRALVRGREVPMRMESADASARVNGFLAEVRIAQEYRNQFRSRIDAVYELQLPADAAVTDLLIVVGKRRIRAVIRERREAEAVYREARTLGHRTSLLELTAGSVLRQRVANLAPGGDIKVETAWLQTLLRSGDRYGLRLPGGGRGGRFSARVSVEAGMAIGGSDFVLGWRLTGKKPVASIVTSRGKDGGTFALFLEPPAGAGDDALPPRDLVLVLDPSSSRVAQTAAAGFARRCLELLRPTDRFRLVPRDDRLVNATRENVSRALEWLKMPAGKADASLGRTLTAALRGPIDSSRPQSVAVITDGSSGEAVAALSRKPDAMQVSAVGVGDRVDVRQLERLAAAGRGLALFAGTGPRVRGAAEHFMRATARPVMTGLRIDWGDVEVADVHPKRIPDLLPGRPLMVVGRFRCAGRRTVKVVGSRGGRKVSMDVELDASEKTKQHPAIGKMWARWQMRELQRSELAAPGAEIR
ncbi:MAG: VIT and vWA domain-containing protein, partial [Planctomycetota bacterium]